MNNFNTYQSSLELLIDSKEDDNSVIFFFEKMRSKNLLAPYLNFLLEKNLLNFKAFTRICSTYFMYSTKEIFKEKNNLEINHVPHYQLDSYYLETYKTPKNISPVVDDEFMIKFFINYLSKEKNHQDVKDSFDASLIGQNLLEFITAVDAEKVIAFLIKEEFNTKNREMFLSKLLSYTFNPANNNIIAFPNEVLISLKEKIEHMPLDKILRQIHPSLLLGSNFANEFLELLLKRKELDTFFSVINEQKVDFRSLSNKTILFEKFTEAKNFSKEVKSILFLCGNKTITSNTFFKCIDEIINSPKTQNFITNIKNHTPFLNNCLIPNKVIYLIEKFNLDMPKALIIEKGYIVYQNEEYLKNYKTILNHFGQQRIYGISTVLKAIYQMEKEGQDYKGLLTPQRFNALISLVRPQEKIVHASNFDEKTNAVVLQDLIKTASRPDLVASLETLYLNHSLEKEEKSARKLKL